MFEAIDAAKTETTNLGLVSKAGTASLYAVAALRLGRTLRNPARANLSAQLAEFPDQGRQNQSFA